MANAEYLERLDVMEKNFAQLNEKHDKYTDEVRFTLTHGEDNKEEKNLIMLQINLNHNSHFLARIAITCFKLEQTIFFIQHKQKTLKEANDPDVIKAAIKIPHGEMIFTKIEETDSVASQLEEQMADQLEQFNTSVLGAVDVIKSRLSKVPENFEVAISQHKAESAKLEAKFTDLKKLIEQIRAFDKNKEAIKKEKEEILQHLGSLDSLSEELSNLKSPGALVAIEKVVAKFEALKPLEEHPSALLRDKYSAIAERVNSLFKSIAAIKATPQNPARVMQTIFPAQNKLHASTVEALGIKYFGARKVPFAKAITPLKGVFPDYLKQRAEKFWFKDFCRDLFAFVFRSYYITGSKDRANYIAELRQAFNNYQRTPASIRRLEQLIDKGLSYFPSRAKPGDKEYADSLAAKLNLLKTDLEALNKPEPPLEAEQIKPR